MENEQYNSLTQKLINDGILSEKKEGGAQNFFELNTNTQTTPKELIEQKESTNITHKRINQYDLDLIKNSSSEDMSDIINFKTIVSISIIRRFLKFKQNTFSNSEGFFFKFFPKLYKAKLVKEAMNKLEKLNINAKNLFDKTIPYGEAQMRYDDLIKYLNCANEIQTNLKRKI